MTCNCSSDNSEHGTALVECIDVDGCDLKPYGFRAHGELYEMPCFAAREFVATWPQRLRLYEIIEE